MNGERDHMRWRADLAAYLLGSLEDHEHDAVDRHLEGCEACREEVLWLRPAVDLLPASVAQVDPPPELRERLLAEVHAEAAPSPAQVAEERARRPAARQGSLRRFLLRPAMGLAGVALVAAVVAGYAIHDDGSAPTTPTTFHGQGAGSLRASLERRDDSGTLKLTGLRQAPASQVYEAWVQRGSRIRPASLFDSRQNGTASVALEHRLAGVDAVMVTLEPRGGSRQPSSPPVVNVALSR